MTHLKVVALATLAFSSLTVVKPAAAALFSKADLDPSKLVLVASPYGNSAHQLLIVEQVANNHACWSESGTSPTMIDPLLVNFDFTGICGRSTDANGYSIRMGDQDLGLQYSLRVVKRNGDLLLVGIPAIARSGSEIQIGRAGGVTNGFAKLYLNPGWRITRRVYNNQALGHYYLTNDQPLNSAIAAAPVNLPVQPSATLPLPSKPLPAAKPSTPLPISRPDIIFAPGSSGTTGSTTPSSPRPASPSIPILVPPPESTAASGSIRPTPLPAPSTTAPIATIPVSGSKTPVRSGANQPANSSRSPITGKPIRVPLPAAATRPIVTPQETPQPAPQPPIVQRPVPSPIVQKPVTQPPVPQPQPASSLPKPKPGDFVVRTTAL